MSKKLQPIETFFTRYHIIVYTLLTALLLAPVILISYNIYIEATTPHTPEVTETTFDAKTIERVDALHSSDDSEDIKLPEGRINPFVGEK